MIFEQTIYDNTDVTAATGLSVATIQTWANRGILMLSKQQQNPGAGQKRLYSALDIARIAATQALISYGLNASTASQIALRLERGLCADQWKEALKKNAGHLFIFLVDGDVGAISTDLSSVDDIRNVLSEDCVGGFLGAATTIQTKVAVFNIGAAISSALQFATLWHKVEFTNLDMPEVFASGLMNSFAKAYRNAGCPDGVEVFHGRDTENEIFYFSPAASAIAPKELRDSTACPEPPSLTGFKKVRL